ncbi:class Ib ribonucleoside-diphosphate reductase assembly flavoprotein NrdI [Bacillus toyonensis]|uniref:class Ib ribonucleoside-diphosphate reductase assembly flavoprotein NrdI n=1 Tax=Bacillus toyonensis TaxID=155322 RepID=UPI002E240C9A|nr:class Ib ribonucleoside-diphosphate reductase assembly flavoprotein NrdI [Bacillus toyonensis]MED2737195.1 class Ib ribonucleoside-diphosphate reductase assembly flavoprotein NrdI [Bacillus toyonensis]
MLIVYASKTGKVKSFINKLGMRAVEVQDGITVQEPFVLITYTIGFGQVPEEVQNFLEDNHKYLRGVISSGNRNWGSNFGKAGDIISQNYRLADGSNVPLLHKFEMAGTNKDVEIVRNRILFVLAA